MNYIFTAVFNNYDQLRDIRIPLGWRALCFTNQNITSNTWEIVQMNETFRIYRDIKIRPSVWLPMDCIKSIWIDGNLDPIISLDEFAMGKRGFWLMSHPDRNCIYEEARACRRMKKDSSDVINKQMVRYIMDGYPEHNGLSATGVIVREHTEENHLFGEFWWNEVKNGSVRDQLSFNYSAWKKGLKFHMFPFLKGFGYRYHLPKQKEMEERRRMKAVRSTRPTAEFYLKYGNQNGLNSETY